MTNLEDITEEMNEEILKLNRKINDLETVNNKLCQALVHLGEMMKICKELNII